MVSMVQSGEALVERVGEVRERKLRELIREFQSESSAGNAHRQWKEIEKIVFGVDYPSNPCRTSIGDAFPGNSANT